MLPEEGQVLTGPQFSEPVRVETVKADGPGGWVVGVVGTKTERYRRVALTDDDLAQITIQSAHLAFDGDPGLLRLGLQAYALGIAFEFDPYFGLSISRVDPLPHQLEAVYDHLLKLAQVRFLLADDAGAGKTIMAGLLVRELKLRGLIERILVVCPANLAFQWQRELKEKFDEKFEVVKGGDLREQYGINQFLERSQVITSLDLAKRDDVLPGLRQVHWDLVIIDEAHRMSWSPPSRKTARYALGELLRDSADHMLMLTATPHKGDPQNFTLFLQLLDPDVYADVTSIRQAMENRRAPFYLRRTKEAMVYFPERAADGEWVARKVFTKRIPHSVDFRIDGDEFELYAEVTRFIRRQSAAAAARGEEARARAVGFLMALYQRRLASSTYALRRSLENRVNRLTELLKKARDIAREAPAEIPSEEELEEMEEADRERWERVLEAITLAGNPEQVREEIAELERLAGLAQAVEETVSEVKLAKLHSLLESEGFFADPDQRLLIFTEFKDTLDYILSKLAAWGLKAGSIHGSMNIGARDIPGTRLYAEQQFKDGDIQVLVATEAAGEGINLQFCHFLINYDIPWKPNRLEQRMGRIHRYGQRHDCLIFNFVATNTVEGRVLERLLHKLQEIRDALDDDAVFNVVGEVMPAAQIERILRDYYAGKLGEEDMEDRLLRGVDEKRFRDICQNALEGLASRKLNLEMLIERRARAQERRVVPETIARFLAEAGSAATLPLREVAGLPHTFDPGRTPTPLRLFEREADWRLPPLVARYPRLSTDRDIADERNLEWVTPGHPLFEALRRHALKQAQPNWTAGACFYSVDQDESTRLDFYRARVVDGLGHTVHERLYAIEIDPEGEARLREPSILGDLTLGASPEEMPVVASLPEATDTLSRLARRERRREELARQRALTLQGVERLASALVLPHPERATPEVARLRPNPETERIAMETVINRERSLGRQVFDISEKNLGYDVTSLDLESGELRLIEVKGLAGDTGIIRLTPNEKRVAEDRRDCYWLYVVTNCADSAVLQAPITDPAALGWHEVKQVAHYYLSVNALTRPIGLSDPTQQTPYRPDR
jgi:superfamily II DNA or RNA helicase